eukprot:GHVP01007473.1.p1 GENE.GHVP01007473.1~~GHVP01007473.1.p1  ORF type:complete len:165 (+),score=29.81 GHVP01007473.1:2-496(+)
MKPTEILKPPISDVSLTRKNETITTPSTSVTEISSEICPAPSTSAAPVCYGDGRVLLQSKVGEGILRFEDGTFYRGELVGMERHGFGLQFEPNGLTYEGQWQNDRKHGRGTTYIEKKKLMTSSLEAAWQDDVMNTTEKVLFTNPNEKFVTFAKIEKPIEGFSSI